MDKRDTRETEGKAITLTFTAETGETARIYEVMILDRRLTLDADGGFSKIEYDNLDLGVNDADLTRKTLLRAAHRGRA